MINDPAWASPMTTRSRVVLEIASELVGDPDEPYGQAKVLLREQGGPVWRMSLFGTSTIEGVHAVVSGESALAIVNPSTALALAYLGKGPYASPQPVRAIAVIPSIDQYVFAVRADTDLETFEQIAERRYPLHVALRGQLDHALHYMLDDIAGVAGFSLDDLATWGGSFRREGPIPRSDTLKFKALVRGDLNAIFDESAKTWAADALDAGMKLLPLSEATVVTLETRGYRRAYLPKAVFPQLPADVLTVDFSGWPILVRPDAPDGLVRKMCAALDARKHLIPWQGDGPLPVERMCRDAEDTPQLVPLHSAAESYWRSLGYLPI